MSEAIEHPGYVGFIDALLSGRLKLGQVLKQEELCDILGISLSPMREATTLLEAEGLITVRRRIGITIFYPDVKFVGNTFQLRGVLEREGLARFARIVDRSWLEKTRAEHRDIIDYLHTAGDPAAYREPMRLLERRFHGSFIAALDNHQINTIYQRLDQKMFLIRLINMDSVGPQNSIRSMTEHLAVLDALEQRDSDAAIQALDKHLQGVLHRVLTG